MSRSHPISTSCPQCHQPLTVEVCDSVNVDRSPELRVAILAATFQQASCPHCQASFQVAPRLSYLDVTRGQWIAVFPLQQIDGWAAAEAEVQATFDQAFGPGAGATAREIGRGLRARLVFGWRALREKLIADEARVDDLKLELLKLMLIRNMSDPPLPLDAELRLMGVDEGSGDLRFQVLDRRDVPLEQVGVPRDLLDESDQDPEGWAPLRERLSAGIFVDMQRLIRGD